MHWQVSLKENACAHKSNHSQWLTSSYPCLILCLNSIFPFVIKLTESNKPRLDRESRFDNVAVVSVKFREETPKPGGILTLSSSITPRNAAMGPIHSKVQLHANTHMRCLLGIWDSHNYPWETEISLKRLYLRAMFGKLVLLWNELEQSGLVTTESFQLDHIKRMLCFKITQRKGTNFKCYLFTYFLIDKTIQFWLYFLSFDYFNSFLHENWVITINHLLPVKIAVKKYFLVVKEF